MDVLDLSPPGLEFRILIVWSPWSHCERGHNNVYLKDPVRINGARTQDARMTGVGVRRPRGAAPHKAGVPSVNEKIRY